MKFLLILLSAFAFGAEFQNETGLSMVETSGNTELSTYNLTTESTWKEMKNLYTVNGHYTYGKGATGRDAVTNELNDAALTARNWHIGGRYERELSKMMNGFAAVLREGDFFAGVDDRTNYDLGIKWIIKTVPNFSHFTRLAYRYTVENLIGQDEDQFNKAVVYYELNKKVNESVSFKFWAEYVPNFDETEDYFINFEPSVIVTLDSTFSLQFAYKGMYDNLPNIDGNVRMDTVQTTSIIAKF